MAEFRGLRREPDKEIATIEAIARVLLRRYAREMRELERDLSELRRIRAAGALWSTRTGRSRPPPRSSLSMPAAPVGVVEVGEQGLVCRLGRAIGARSGSSARAGIVSEVGHPDVSRVRPPRPRETMVARISPRFSSSER